MMVVDGFLGEFSAQYVGGCANGYVIIRFSNFNLLSPIATPIFMTGGFILKNFDLPSILALRFNYLKSHLSGYLGSKIKWNFTKFLLDKNGKPVKRFAPTTKPKELELFIEEII